MVYTIPSYDLDSHYRKESKEPKHIGFTESISEFSSKELIIALTNRYCKLTDKASNRLIEEIRNRRISKLQIKEFYIEAKVFKNPFNGSCPCCQSSSFLTEQNYKITDCLICGFNHRKDNPN
ncbi:hypothetical protein [Labilibacter marinus]|uniref:hypothetical protein n=1 Tax=Labilibacter marinus TaxID=1477105 RepID=UPI0008302C64|nr:hypothetical protein [Labilibacter marinus]